MTSQLTTAEAAIGFDQVLASLQGRLDGQLLMSQDRCVDALLDLYNAAPTDVVRALITEVIDDIRHVSAVKSDEFKVELDQLAAAAAVEGAFFN